MSTPKNHHYVSQCHQKEFFNKDDNYIFLYDKELSRFYYKRSTKNLFSKDNLNSKVVNGKLDQITLEKELKMLFEDDFAKHVAQIKKFIKDQTEMQLTYESLFLLTILGILGDLRHPKFKENLDYALLEFESNIFSRIYDFDKKKVFEILKREQITHESNNISYISIAIQTLFKMEPIDFEIYFIKSEDHFLLPDTSCYQIRGQLDNYINTEIREIIQVGIPLTDKLFILATPKSLNTEHHGIQVIDENDSKLVYGINKCLYDFAKKAVACKDEHYLKRVISFFQ